MSSSGDDWARFFIISLFVITRRHKTMQTEKKFDDALYQKLLSAVDSLPINAIERASKAITRKGYDTTGYQYQFLVNVLNEVVGVANWMFDYSIVKETEGKFQNGMAYFDITIELILSICGVERKCVGGHRSGAHADAVKGAITNAFKKTVALFGVGKRAYEGTIDEDYRAPEVERVAVNKSAPLPVIDVGWDNVGSERETPHEEIMTNIPVKNPPGKPMNVIKKCVICGKEHSGNYNKCLDCWKATRVV